MKLLYGDHSNHLPVTLGATGNDVAFAAQTMVNWMNFGSELTTRTAGVTGGRPSPILVMAASASGRVVIGGVISEPLRNPKSINLAVLAPGSKSIWERPASDDVAPAPELEPAVLGLPTSAHSDLVIWSPLSAAISNDGTLVAAADYQGWQRLYDPEKHYTQNQVLRFMPAKPVIQVYTAEGTPVRRFGPEAFATPGWYDLSFTPDKRQEDLKCCRGCPAAA